MHVLLEEYEDAMRELARAYDEHSSSLHFIGIAPEFAPLRSDKRFTSIVKKIGLEPQKVFAVKRVDHWAMTSRPWPWERTSYLFRSCCATCMPNSKTAIRPKYSSDIIPRCDGVTSK